MHLRVFYCLFKLTLPPRLKQQLLYSRFVNTQGVAGANIPLDLHVEHINRVVKTAIYNQTSNLSPTAVIRTSRCTGTFVNIGKQFDKVSHLHRQSSAHSKARHNQDIARIVKQLHDTSHVFDYMPRRQHTHFKSLHCSVIAAAKQERDEIEKWIKGYLTKASANRMNQ